MRVSFFFGCVIHHVWISFILPNASVGGHLGYYQYFTTIAVITVVQKMFHSHGRYLYNNLL